VVGHSRNLGGKDQLGATYGGVTALVSGLSDPDFDRPTRCEGLTVGALLFHLLMDAQRALMAFATPTDPPPDRDFVTYWRDFPPPERTRSTDADTDPHVRFVLRAVTAYAHPADGLVHHWRDTAEAAARAADAAPATGFVGTQGHVLAVPDFIATLVFEAAIHQLDLALELPTAAGPPGQALDVVVATLDGLLGADARALTGWDATTYALKGTGRTPLDPDETDALGEFALRIPLLG
jgi:uncharacterized protein (TIGR03083 family)